MQIIALSFLVRYNKFHQSIFMNATSEITGRLNEKYNGVEYYFQLKATNDILVKENERLHRMSLQNQGIVDVSKRLIIDTVKIDSARRIQKYYFMAAKVVGNTTNFQTNFITLHRGSAQGVRPNMGVVSPQGIAGTIVNVSQNYSVAMSLLHLQYKVVVKLKNGGERGTVEWDGKSPLYITLKDIPKSARVNNGDSVITSETSSLFPSDIMVGTVSEIVDDKSSNFYTIKLRPATNFFNVEYVYVIDNTQFDEQKNLEDSTRKKFQ
jgi:rod shape-determining protein MreC